MTLVARVLAAHYARCVRWVNVCPSCLLAEHIGRAVLRRAAR